MKPNELRIGNWVEQPNNGVTRVTAILNDLQIKTETGYIDKYCRPIPLTEEWLLNFGFVRCGYEDLFWEHQSIKGFQLAGINWADSDEPDYQFLNYSIGDEIFSIHYLHQLQNLYFALTGEELTLNEKQDA